MGQNCSLCSICSKPASDTSGIIRSSEDYFANLSDRGMLKSFVDVKIVTYLGKYFTLTVNAENTVGEIKKIINTQRLIPVNNQHFYANDARLLIPAKVKSFYSSESEIFLYFEQTEAGFLHKQLEHIYNSYGVSQQSILVTLTWLKKYSINVPLLNLTIALVSSNKALLLEIMSSCTFSRIVYYGECFFTPEEMNEIQDQFFCSTVEFTLDIQVIKECKVIVVTDPPLWEKISEQINYDASIVLVSKTCEINQEFIEMVEFSSPFSMYSWIIQDINTEHGSHRTIIHAIQDLLAKITSDIEGYDLSQLFRKLEIPLYERGRSNEFYEYIHNKIIENITVLSQSFQEKNLPRSLDSFLQIISLYIASLAFDYFKLSDLNAMELVGVIATKNIVPRGYLDIKHNYLVSPLGITLVLNYIAKGDNLRYIDLCYETRRELYQINSIVKELILESLKIIIKTQEGKQALQILDRAVSSPEEENSIITELVEGEMISIPSGIPLGGKLALGGCIFINQITLDYHSLYPLGVARFAYIF